MWGQHPQTYQYTLAPPTLFTNFIHNQQSQPQPQIPPTTLQHPQTPPNTIQQPLAPPNTTNPPNKSPIRYYWRVGVYSVNVSAS